MRRMCFALGVALLCVAETCHAEMKLGNRTLVIFATAEEGKRLLETRDDFVERLSPFDRSSRMKTEKDISEEEFLKFAGENALTWTDPEKARFESAFRRIQKRLESLSLPFPEKILVIRTTGNEEGGAAYTRGNAIIFSTPEIAVDVSTLPKKICHELFHVLTRANPELRERFYEVIGFAKCDELDFPTKLAARKITNPDAPKNDHCIRLKAEGKECWAIPILLSRTEKYDTQRGGAFFDYLQFELLMVERNGVSSVKALYDGEYPRLADVELLTGFFEQVGRNTGYIIHPEEILADNFAILVLGRSNVPSPEILVKMEKVLAANPTAEPKNPATSQ